MYIPVGYAHVLASIFLTGDNELMAITFGVEVTSPPLDQGDADGISGATGTFLKGIMTNNYGFAGVDVAVGNDGTDPIHVVSTFNAGAGTQATTPVPQNTAYLLKKRSMLGGRTNRGRCFVPGVAEGQVDHTGVVSPSMVTQINTAAATWLAALSANNTPMVILHNDPLQAPTAVTSVVADTRVATQRRRLR